MQTVNADNKKYSLTYLLEKIRHPRIVSFFMGWEYPIWIAFSVLVGRATNLEVYFAIIDLILISIAFISCNSMRPILPILISFLYRIPLEHSPGVPYYSDYYTTSKLVVPFILLGIALTSLVALLIRKKCFTLENLKKLPLLIPLSIFSLAFLLGGSFSGVKTAADVYFGLFQILVFAIVFWLLYLGLKDEKASELCSYFTYVCAVVAVILILEVAHLYIFGDVGLESGSINKGLIYFGWGISNTCANCLTVLIPICFLGVIKSKYHIAYFAIATLAYLANVLTLSRNGVLFGFIFYAISIIICCFYGDKKKIYRYITVAGIAVCFIGVFIFREKIGQLFASMISNGFSDNGRYPIWRDAFDAFCEYPLFGKGFYFFKIHAQRASFIPFLAHNTILQIMMAMGLFGITAYLVYRVFTLVPFVKKPRIEKTMFLLSIGVLIAESLLDNFILWFAPTFVYNIAIIIAIKYLEEDKTSSKEKVLSPDNNSSEKEQLAENTKFFGEEQPSEESESFKAEPITEDIESFKEEHPTEGSESSKEEPTFEEDRSYEEN